MNTAFMAKLPEAPEVRISRLETGFTHVHSELLEVKSTVTKHTGILEAHTKDLAAIHQTLDEHTATLAEHSNDLRIIKQTQAEHSIRFDVMEDKMEAGFAAVLARFDKIDPSS